MNQKRSRLLSVVAFAFSMLLGWTLPQQSYSQTPSSRIRLYDPDTVCMSLHDFHTIAAKRAVSDSLSRARARLFVQQNDLISALYKQVDACSKENNTIMTQWEVDKRDCEDVLTANQDLQIKLAKARQWSTIGKVQTGLISLVVIAVVVSAIAP